MRMGVVGAAKQSIKWVVVVGVAVGHAVKVAFFKQAHNLVHLVSGRAINP